MLERLPSSDIGPSLAYEHADANALEELLGKDQSGTRGHILHPPGKFDVLVTIHPSALLRIREPDMKEKNRLTFIRDLKKIRSFLRH